MVGDGIETNVDGINPRQGPGRYTVEVHHAGRDQAEAARQEVLAALTPDDYVSADDIKQR
jgi:hypothetical protein